MLKCMTYLFFSGTFSMTPLGPFISGCHPVLFPKRDSSKPICFSSLKKSSKENILDNLVIGGERDLKKRT